MARWVVKRVIEFKKEVEAGTRQEALGAFSEVDARTRILRETAFKNCRLATDDSIFYDPKLVGIH